MTLQLPEPVPPVLQAGDGDVGDIGLSERGGSRVLRGEAGKGRGGKASPPPGRGLGRVLEAEAGASDAAGRGVGGPPVQNHRTPARPCSRAQMLLVQIPWGTCQVTAAHQAPLPCRLMGPMQTAPQL